MKTTKLLLTTIAVLLCSVRANAYDFEVNGIYYNIISATDLIVEVTSGDNKYTGEVIIPTMVNYKSKDLAVTSIGASAFDGCDGLSNITIPNNVKTIGQGAFNNCMSLKELRIEDGDTNLEMGIAYSYEETKHPNPNSYRYEEYSHTYGLFHDCPLEILYIGRNITYTCMSKFYENEDYDYYVHIYSPFNNKIELLSVSIGKHVTTIGPELFSNCSILEKITIPKNVTNIKDRAFDNCTSLKELYIEDGNTNLELGVGKTVWLTSTLYNKRGLFHDCPLESIYLGRDITYSYYLYLADNSSPFSKIQTLKSVTIGDSVTIISKNLFQGCSNLTYAPIGDNVTVIDTKAFAKCGIINITIPNSVEKIGTCAFDFCNLEHVNFEDSENNLYTDGTTFRGSTKNVYMGRNLKNTTSDHSCIFDNMNIDTLTIGSHVTAIGEKTFDEGANITCIYSMCTNPPLIDSGNNFTDQQYVYTTIFVPKGALNAYQTADVWKNFWDIQEYCLDKKFCVNYYIDEALYAVDSIKYGDIITLRAEPTKEGYTFSGWSEVPETMPAHNVEVYGNFFLSSDVDNLELPSQKSPKVIENNQIVIILPNGKKYNIMGQKM